MRTIEQTQSLYASLEYLARTAAAQGLTEAAQLIGAAALAVEESLRRQPEPITPSLAGRG